MKHRKPGPYILLATCSNCKQEFGPGTARFMLGIYPLEQFCTHRCAEEYLENGQDLTRAIQIPSLSNVKSVHRHSK
jgi:hypothetical protein